jgi:hypothetical protein
MYAQSHVSDILRTLKDTSEVTKTQRNYEVLLLTRFKTLWRSGIRINLKIDANVGVAFVSGVRYMVSINDSEGSMLISAHASTVYAVRRMKSKTKHILPTALPTQPNLT